MPDPRDPVGVGVDEGDLLHRNTKDFRGEHRERSRMTLAVNTRTGEHAGRAVVVDLDGAELHMEAHRSGHLDVGRNADAESDRVVLAALGLLGAQLRVARRDEDGIERLFVFARVVRSSGVGCHGEGVGLDEVPAADFRRIHADLGRRDIDDPLDELRGLGATGTSVCTDGGRVREDGTGVELDLLNVVHADGHHLGEHRKDGADGRVRTGVGGYVALEPGELSVFGHAQLGRHHEVTPVHERNHVF